ncbi:hypothetical protein V6U90_13460 [Micromonospora sp. CPCC 206060]|uniref:hypothetical protein n=1 Tax=Micromonospora sp. CPCC 206060 TaxID=3122406 RepID=UPI002FEEAC7D
MDRTGPAETGSAPTDFAASRDDQLLAAHQAVSHTISLIRQHVDAAIDASQQRHESTVEDDRRSDPDILNRLLAIQVASSIAMRDHRALLSALRKLDRQHRVSRTGPTR